MIIIIFRVRKPNNAHRLQPLRLLLLYYIIFYYTAVIKKKKPSLPNKFILLYLKYMKLIQFVLFVIFFLLLRSYFHYTLNNIILLYLPFLPIVLNE